MGEGKLFPDGNNFREVALSLGMNVESDIFSRTEMLVGSEAMEQLRRTKVIIFGLGGVGSFSTSTPRRKSLPVRSDSRPIAPLRSR